jgi:hypothetical protein
MGVTGDFFNTSYTPWRDGWLIDIGETSHMTFQRDFFEHFNDNVYGVVYFANKLSLKPLGMGTIKLKFPGFLDFLPHNVLYLPELQRTLLSLVHIQQ